MTRTQLQLSDRLYGRAKRYADRREMSMAELFRNAIEMYVTIHLVDECEAAPSARWTPPVCRKGDLLCDPFANENWRDEMYHERNHEVEG